MSSHHDHSTKPPFQHHVLHFSAPQPHQTRRGAPEVLTRTRTAKMDETYHTAAPKPTKSLMMVRWLCPSRPWPVLARRATYPTQKLTPKE
jgi:hypothetical protein